MKSWQAVGEPEDLAVSFGKRLFVQDFINPRSGEKVGYSFWGSKRVPAIVLPVTDDSQVILVKTFRHAARIVSLEVPGGNRDGDEEWHVVAERELREETGYEAQEIIPLSREGIWFEPQSLAIPFYPFLALGCRVVHDQKLDENEDVETFLMPLREWVEMVFGGEIRDSKSITITALAMSCLKARSLV